MKAKILILDVETAPNLVYTWGLYDQNIGINQIKEGEFMLCWSAKWLDSKKVYFDSLIEYPSYFKKHPKSDEKIAKSIWKLVDEADIVVTHNGNNFDLKWLNTIFLKNGLKPASTFKSVDTLREVRGNFRFPSYRLDRVCQELGLGAKQSHEGFEMWRKCMGGDRKAWKKMVDYNKQDVVILEKLYLKLRPFMKSHPNLSLYHSDIKDLKCPLCGGTHFKKKGFAYTQSNKYQRFVCVECGKNIRTRDSVITKDNKKKVPLNG